MAPETKAAVRADAKRAREEARRMMRVGGEEAVVKRLVSVVG